MIDIDMREEEEEGEGGRRKEGGQRRQENKNPTLRMWGTEHEAVK